MFFAGMAIFIFFFIDIEVETPDKKMTFTQEFSWVNIKTNKEETSKRKEQKNMYTGLESTSARILHSNVFLRHLCWSW